MVSVINIWTNQLINKYITRDLQMLKFYYSLMLTNAVSNVS